MTWIWIILGIIIIVFIINLLSGSSVEESTTQAANAGIGCAVIIFQIFLAVVGLWVLLWVGNWLFG